MKSTFNINEYVTVIPTEVGALRINSTLENDSTRHARAGQPYSLQFWILMDLIGGNVDAAFEGGSITIG